MFTITRFNSSVGHINNSALSFIVMRITLYFPTGLTFNKKAENSFLMLHKLVLNIVASPLDKVL